MLSECGVNLATFGESGLSMQEIHVLLNTCSVGNCFSSCNLLQGVCMHKNIV